LDTSKGSAITFWVEGLPENADLNNVRATLGGQKLRMLYLEPVTGKAATGLFRKAAPRQVNAGLTGEPPKGRVPLAVTVGDRLAGQLVVNVRG
jgi:hypothetical protein